MELLFIVPGLFCLAGIALVVAVVALVTVRKVAAPAAVQQTQGQNASVAASVGPAPGGTIAIGSILGWLDPTAGGQPVPVVEDQTLGRVHLNPNDDVITRGDHVRFSRVVSSSGTLVIAEVLHANGIEVGGRRITSGRVQVPDGATLKAGTTEFTFRKA